MWLIPRATGFLLPLSLVFLKVFIAIRTVDLLIKRKVLFNCGHNLCAETGGVL